MASRPPAPTSAPVARGIPPDHRSAFWDLTDELLAVLDGDGTVLDANPAWQRVLGLDRSAVARRKLADLLGDPGLHEHLTSDGGAVVRRVVGSDRRVAVTLHDTTSGRWLIGRVLTERLPEPLRTAAPDDDAAPSILNWDVLRHGSPARRVHDVRDRVREAHRAAHLTTWEWDPCTDRLQASPELIELAGLTPARLTSMAAAAELVPSTWHERLREGLDGVVRHGRSYEVWHPVVVPNGDIRWLELIAWPVTDQAGRVRLVRGTSQNVTAEHDAQERARAERDFNQATLDSLPAHVAVLDGGGDIISTNRAWTRFAERNGGCTAATGIGANYLRACDASDHAEGRAVASGLRDVLAGRRDTFRFAYPCHAPDELRWFELHASRFAGDGECRLVVRHEDVTELHRAESQASTRGQLLDVLDAAVISLDADWCITDWNAAAERLYGWTLDEVRGRAAADVIVPAAESRAVPDVRAALQERGRWQGEFRLRRRDGTEFTALVHTTTIRDADGSPVGYVGLAIDLSDRLQTERDLRSARQYVEAVTDSIGEGVCTLDETGRLVYMNHAAERLLGWSAQDLAGASLHDVAHYRHADGSSRSRDDSPLTVARATGRVVHVDDDVFVRRDGELLPVEYTAAPLETADGVLGTVFVFSDITERKAERDRLAQEVEALTWVTRIREALQHDRFRLHAQPIIDLRTGAVVQHELLIRMLDEDGSLVPPGLFLPIAEEYGIITEIDRWVIARAAVLAGRGYPVELNLSAASLSDRTLADTVEQELRAAGARPADVVIELTETAILRDEDVGRAFLERVAALGCKVALDDFGTGYGGFTYLKKLPVDYLKIDIEFVRDLPRDPASQQVVQAVVHLAAGLGKLTVAEGVEDDETLELLKRLGVDYAQGYGIGRPAPVEDTMPGV